MTRADAENLADAAWRLRNLEAQMILALDCERVHTLIELADRLEGLIPDDWRAELIAWADRDDRG